MITLAWSLIAFIIAVLILVTVHEFGHFIVARLLGIRVKIFSIGFGRAFYVHKGKSGTRYVLACIPLGGYVKLLDETNGPVAKNNLPFAFNRQSLIKRIAVVSAGPVFNLLFAVFCYFLMFCIGIQSITPIVGDVTPNSFAERAGLHKDEQIVEINHHPAPTWRNLRYAIIEHLGKSDPLQLKVKHREHEHTRDISISLHELRLSSRVNPVEAFGITPYVPSLPPIVGEVLPHSAAASAGLMSGDEISHINEKPVTDWSGVAKTVHSHPGETLIFKVTRDDQRLTIGVHLHRAHARNEPDYGVLGVKSLPIEFPENLIITERFNPIAALVKGFEETQYITILSYSMIGKLLIGHVSLGNITGPLGIAQGAGQSASIGLNYFLHFLAVASVSLAVINLLPIPVLDGGHLVYLLLEAIRRKPVSEELRQIGMKCGVVFIFAITLLAIYNDISRIITQ